MDRWYSSFWESDLSWYLMFWNLSMMKNSHQFSWTSLILYSIESSFCMFSIFWITSFIFQGFSKLLGMISWSNFWLWRLFSWFSFLETSESCWCEIFYKNIRSTNNEFYKLYIQIKFYDLFLFSHKLNYYFN